MNPKRKKPQAHFFAITHFMEDALKTLAKKNQNVLQTSSILEGKTAQDLNYDKNDLWFRL